MRFSSSINDENKASFRRKNWRKYTQKNFKNIAEGYRENRALTELPIMCFGTVPETLKWAFCFLFLSLKIFLRNISVNINFDVSLVLTENSL